MSEDKTRATDHSDIDAVKQVVDALEGFEPGDQQRIIRWACEKLGIAASSAPVAIVAPSSSLPSSTTSDLTAQSLPSMPGTRRDIRSFIDSKKPANDMQFAAAVAYFYAFEAPEADRKDSIGPDDLQDACRQLGRARLHNPGQTLRNACYHGLLDKAGDRGNYKLNTVGENLVAVTLPGENSSAQPRKSSVRKPKKNAKGKTRPV
jgi:hypothetical protein